MRIRNYFKQKKSKKGLTLVEVLCAIFVLAIVFVGVLNAVAFSRQMVFTNNSREKASFKGQLVADEVLSIATGFNPNEDPTDMLAQIDNVLNDMSDPQNNDSETAVGKVERVNTLSDPASFNPGDSGALIQCKITGVTSETSNEVSDGSGTYTEAVEIGWDITVRVFYREISGDSDFRCIDITAFAPSNYIDDVT